MNEHTKDSDCTVGNDGLCVDCGVDHEGACESCGRSGFHDADCQTMALAALAAESAPLRRLVAQAAGRVLLVLLMASSAFGAEKPKDGQFELAGKLLWTFTAADIVSTEMVLANGGYEMNPVVRNRAVRIGYKIGAAYATNKITDHLRKKGHGRIASIVRWSTVAALAFATGNNVVVYSF